MSDRIDFDGDEVKNALKARQRVQIIRLTWQTFLWFTLPFLALYGLGVSPENAARTSAGISAFMAVVFAACSLMMSWLVSAMVWVGKTAQEMDEKKRSRM